MTPPPRRPVTGRPARPRPAPARPAAPAARPEARPRALPPAEPRPSTGSQRTAPGDPRTTGEHRTVPTPLRPSGPRTAREPAPDTGGQPQVLDPHASTVTTYTSGRRGFALPVRASVVSERSAERFAERARARRRLAVRQVVIGAGGLLAVGSLAWLLLLSPVFALDPARVAISGAGTVVAVDQVAAVVGARAGTPLPRLDTVALRDDVLEVPGVREARVMRDWPRGLVVELVSREPVAAVPEPPSTSAAAPDGPVEGFALLDMEGIQVGRVDVPPEGLPVVRVPVGDARTLRAVLTVLEALPPDLLGQVGEVSAETQDTVSMVLRDGAEVVWGSAHETALKIAVLQALRAAPTSAGAAVFDVSAPTLPITR
ncbi:cell division protein FtsQ/DivIB [Cellulomonas sp. NPDC055163]